MRREFDIQSSTTATRTSVVEEVPGCMSFRLIGLFGKRDMIQIRKVTIRAVEEGYNRLIFDMREFNIRLHRFPVYHKSFVELLFNLFSVKQSVLSREGDIVVVGLSNSLREAIKILCFEASFRLTLKMVDSFEDATQFFVQQKNEKN